jgi:signal transduction histidine kinase
METLFEELKRYVGFDSADEATLRALHPLARPHFDRIAGVFYERILDHEGARQALVGGESRVGQLKITLVAWMERLLSGPWDEEYYQLRCRIGRVHVRIALPQHYMFGAMNVLRRELVRLTDEQLGDTDVDAVIRTRTAIDKILDLELAIMLHTYREDLEAQKARGERLATFGQLIGSIGHELRNPLGVIESSLYILDQRVGGDERAHRHVERIGEQLKIANNIISALLDMIRDRPLSRAPLSLAATIEAVLSTLNQPRDVTLVVDGVDALPAIDGDAGQIRQVLTNLIENALHAVGSAGQVRISGARSDGGVEVAIEDSGPGVDPDTRRRLFEPLITTKQKGIGLGLALVKRIVERHGGTVAYEPGPGTGARFVVRLPVGERHA